jgi:nucleotide-binding universal stress UspA family protein
MHRILVGYDGSEQAARALDFAIDLATLTEDSEIHLAYVVQKPGGIPDPVPDEVIDSLRKTGEEELMSAEKLVKREFVKTVIHIESGNPGERLLQLADQVKPDLVVLGTLKHSTSERLLGTVSSFFLKSRRYPLLIVP